MLSIKPGVRLDLLTPQMVLGHLVVQEVFRDLGCSCVVTSARDGQHSPGSKHHIGDALDYRTRELDPTQQADLARLCRLRLGNDFDVVLEATHLHVEFDPKREVVVA